MGNGTSLAGKKILIVEDNYLVAEDLRRLVNDADGEVSLATSNAHADLDDQEFDGALLDVQLHDGTCIDIARQLARRHIPFVIVTGYARSWLAPELQQAPYLAKPFDGAQLVELAARHFIA
jgi:DNA-binding response OmpR family regulator